MTEGIFNPKEKEEEDYLLLGRAEGEADDEFVDRIVEEYKDSNFKEQVDFKKEVRLYLHQEKQMTDGEMGELLEESSNVIGSWRRRNGLKPNDWERKTPPKKTKRNDYYRTEREKELVVKLVLSGLNFRKDPDHSPEKSPNLRELLDNTGK